MNRSKLCRLSVFRLSTQEVLFFNVVLIVVFFEHYKMHISQIHVVFKVTIAYLHEISGV